MKKIVTILLALTTIMVSAQEKPKNPSSAAKPGVKVKKPKTVKTASGLEYTITTIIFIKITGYFLFRNKINISK